MTNVNVISSKDLNPSCIDSLEEKIKFKFGNVNINYKTDKTLLAGLIIQFGDTEYHYDLRSQLEFVFSQIIS